MYQIHIFLLSVCTQVIDLLGSTGPGSAQAPVFGLRAKVWAYPESCFSVWVMLAVRFKAA